MNELWIKTKTEEVKSYFCHAVSRDSTWTRPDGPHIKIMSQHEFEAMNKHQIQKQQQEKPIDVQSNFIQNQSTDNNIIDGYVLLFLSF